MAIKHYILKPNSKLTKKQLRELEAAAKRPIVYDEDCPELTEEQLQEMARLAPIQRAERRKQVVSLRISPETLKKAQALGKGYTGVLSRLLDLAINDAEMVKRCL